MRKFVLSVLFGVFLIACNYHAVFQKQLEDVEAVIESNPDSAWVLLGEIPTSLLGDGEERAWYNLLLTEATYKLYKSFKNDSLINYSVNYYERKGNSNRLATALYYKSAVHKELENKEKAIQCLKMAEKLSIIGEDELLRNKIYGLLYEINLYSRNLILAEEYALKYLRSSEILERPDLIAWAYSHLAVVNSWSGNEKEFEKYMNLALIYADSCDVRGKSQIFCNFANNLIQNNQYVEAKIYLNKAVTLQSTADEYILLGQIYEHEGDTLNARLNWEKALSFNDPLYSVYAYKYLSRQYYDNRNYKLALLMWARGDSVSVIHQTNMYQSKLTEIQKQYDTAVMEKALTEKKNKWLTLAIITLIILFMVLLGLLFYVRKAKIYKGIINQKIEQIYQNDLKIKLLEDRGQDFEHEIEVLKDQTYMMKEATIQTLGRGKLIYDAMMNRERIYNFTKKKEQDFVDYYAFTFSEQYHVLIAPYKSPTLRHTTYLIMRQMGLDDKTIGTTLNIADSTIRNYRYRLK